MNMKKILSLVLVACLGGLVAVGLVKIFDKKENMSIEERQKVAFANLNLPGGNPGFNFVDASALVTPAVVHIKTTIESSQNNGGLDFFDFFGDDLNMPHQGPGAASGSGVIITDDGYITTNNHVVEGASSIEVVLFDKRTYRADLVGTDPTTDLALLKIDEKALPFVRFGNSDAVKVGEWVLAVGNPFNLTSTVTAGIVSAKGRNIHLLRDEKNQYAIENFIQTDAAVNPGNSGGALVNLQGELIGINTAIATQTGSFSGYSFAVPVNIVKKVMDDLLKYGEVQRGFLGIEITDVTAKVAEDKNLSKIRGVYVNKVNEGSAAEKAGMKEGDVILKINEVEVNSSSELQEQVSRYHPGDKLNVTVLRKDKEMSLTATLKNREGTTEIVKSQKDDASEKLFGMDMSSITKADKDKYGIKNGVKISGITAGPLKKAHVPDGFIVTQIDKKPVYTPGEVKRMLENKKGGVLIEGMNPDGSDGVYGLKIE